MSRPRALKEKILLLLLGGLAFGFTYSPLRHKRILKAVAREWKAIDEKALWQEIRKLYRSRLVTEKENSDGSLQLLLTKEGKLKTLTYRFEEMEIKRGDWDGKWRIVIFDIPERLRKGRDDLRNKLKELGFFELQKSVFVFPFECDDEIDFVIEFFNLRPYVRTGILERIDNDIHLRKIFKLV